MCSTKTCSKCGTVYENIDIGFKVVEKNSSYYAKVCLTCHKKHKANVSREYYLKNKNTKVKEYKERNIERIKVLNKNRNQKVIRGVTDSYIIKQLLEKKEFKCNPSEELINIYRYYITMLRDKNNFIKIVRKDCDVPNFRFHPGRFNQTINI